MPHSYIPLSFILRSPRYTSPLPGSPTVSLWREVLVSITILNTFSMDRSKGALPSAGSLHRAPSERSSTSRAPFIHFSKSLVNIPQGGPYEERCSISRANGLFIHLYPSESPVKEPFQENGENIWSPSTKPHADGRPT